MATESFTIFIDGLCPLCKREAALLTRLDRRRGRLTVVDIADPAFDPGTLGVGMEQFMGTIHGRTADGRIVTGMEVFRRAYSAVGWGAVLSPTGWPALRPVFDALYRWFARHRLRLTGRGGAACAGGTCRMPAPAGAAREPVQTDHANAATCSATS